MSTNNPFHESNRGFAGRLLKTICDEHSHSRLGYDEVKTAILELQDKYEDGDDDFHFEFDGNEYRIIKDSAIWEIYKEGIQEIVNDCYSDVLKLDDIPSFIAFEIDWEQTANNCYVDGYGHHFSSYDGSECEYKGYWIFRTN